MRSPMMAYWKLFATLGIVSYFLACSPVKFTKVPAASCQGAGLACIKSCTEKGCFDKFVDVKTVGTGMVDILIVNDNSGSMSYEQNHMGTKFPNFISSLGNLDYRIAMITTDVSSNVSSTLNNPPGPNNGNGAFQDGNLLEFSPGLKFLERSTPNAASLFNTAVRRQETLTCEQNNYQTGKCPSGDERGIFSANLAIQNSDFMRPTAPLAIVVLADEDVRSGIYPGGQKNPNGSISGFALEANDQPENLISNFKSRFPTKTLSAHSIVVKSGDTTCLNAQAAQGGSNPYVSGSFGKLYEKLSQLTGGVVGSICSNDYGAELGQIGYQIQNQVTSMSFVCRPVNDDFDVTFTPALQTTVNAVADFDRLVVEFDQPLPQDTKVTLSYTCETLKN